MHVCLLIEEHLTEVRQLIILLVELVGGIAHSLVICDLILGNWDHELYTILNILDVFLETVVQAVTLFS